MPNQLNYPAPLDTTSLQRPSRLTELDLSLIANQNRQILFGTNDRDHIELWVYFPDGSVAGHLNFSYDDAALTLTTLIDTTGPYEVMNIDLHAICERLKLDPGRYVIVANFFRDEVGSETGYKMYIKEISDDRTEVRLAPARVTRQALADVYEFVVPSVPKLYAQGLIAEVLGKSQDAGQDEQVTIESFVAKNETYIQGVLQRILRSDSVIDLVTMFRIIMDRTYSYALDYMVNDVQNHVIQQQELEGYLSLALNVTIQEMIDRGEISPFFQLV